MADGVLMQSEVEKIPEGQSAKLVTCFVCKQEVEVSSVVRMQHPKAGEVWVCKDHVKKQQ